MPTPEVPVRGMPRQQRQGVGSGTPAEPPSDQVTCLTTPASAALVEVSAAAAQGLRDLSQLQPGAEVTA